MTWPAFIEIQTLQNLEIPRRDGGFDLSTGTDTEAPAVTEVTAQL